MLRRTIFKGQEGTFWIGESEFGRHGPGVNSA
jgi:hypothetical protein